MNIVNQAQPKIYPKTFEDICKLDKFERGQRHMSSVEGSMESLSSKFEDFYRGSHEQLFEMAVKEIWLEQQIEYNGVRRNKRYGNGIENDRAFGLFTKFSVGISHRVITANSTFTPVATYFNDFFPEFLDSDPFESPEDYEYPYKHITLDFLVFVYEMDNRLELLAEAERKEMTYAEFVNWVINWALSYNIDKGDDIYMMCGGRFNWPHVKNIKQKRSWINSKFNFKKKYE